MEQQVSGTKELLFVETTKLSLSLTGKCGDVFQSDANSSVKVLCGEILNVYIKGQKQERSNELSNEVGCENYATIPLFFEQTAYTLNIESEDDDLDIQFVHSNPNLVKGIVKVSRKHNNYSGILNFGNHIGYSDLVIMVNGAEYLRIVIEVYPSKLDYKKDFEAIRDDVDREINGLLYDFLQSTYEKYGISRDVASTDIAFLAILESVYNEMQIALKTILKHPHFRLQKEYNVLLSHKVKKTDDKCVKWLLKHPNHVRSDNRNLLIDKCLSVKKYVTNDTKENRILKHLIADIVRKIDRLILNVKALDNKDRQEAAFIRLKNLRKGIATYINTSFLREVNEDFSDIGMSLVFSLAPGYRELYKCYLTLKRGIDLTDDILKVHLKDLAKLYEYWCYVKLNSILRKDYHLDSVDEFTTEQIGLVTKLVRGNLSEIRYTNQFNGDKFSMLYNSMSERLPTTTQIPDNVLCLKKRDSSGCELVYQYVFDAKYRIDDGKGYDKNGNRYNNKPGPKEDDINTMHRYRDAIVFAEKHDSNITYKREMYGAYVLFPYSNESEYVTHRYYQSIDKVNVGGLPFLPSAYMLVRSLLGELINDSPMTADERGVLPRNISRQLKVVDWKSREMLVGFVKKDEYSIILQHNFYHTKCKNIANPHMIKYVALYKSLSEYQDDAGIEYWGEVENVQEIKRRELQEIPKDSDEYYYVFRVKKWEQRSGGQLRGSANIRTMFYTSKFVFEQSLRTSQLLCKTEDLWRLSYEIAYRCESDDKKGTFIYKGAEFHFDDSSVKVLCGGRVLTSLNIKDFGVHTNKKLKDLNKMICDCIS